MTRTVALLLAAGCLLAAACGDPQPAPRRDAETPPRDEGPPRLKLLPYRVESGPLATPVEAEGAGAVENLAFAFFDLGAEVAWQTAEAEGAITGSAGRGGVVGSAAAGGRVGQEAAGGLAGTGTTGERVGQEAAGGLAGTGSTGARVVQTGEGSFQEAGAGGERVTGGQSGAMAGTGGSRRLLGRGDRRRFSSQEEYEDFLLQQAELLRARSRSLAELIAQDKLLHQIYALSQGEFRRHIRDLTRERSRVLRLVKTASVEAIRPGETFDYILELQNSTGAAVRRMIIYDEFPPQLQFENRYRVLRVRPDGGEIALSAEGEEVIGFLTPNEWEAGKIAWNLPERLRLGGEDRLQLRFQATWYLERGAPAADGVPLRAAGDAAAEVLGTAGTADLVLVALRQEAFLRVSLRRAGSGERLEGWLAAEAYRPEAMEDATDFERRLQQTVFFGAENAGRQRP
ncbi:MAG: hypothetical protein HY722_05050 [Planctomycetes bacterium]|nr:hypothetical protein [Planctomycetota bacterium]